MFNGFNRGSGRGGGAGLGFRGSTPPWPYVGRGRGGLPRCRYYIGDGAPMAGLRPRFTAGGQMSREDELAYMKGEVERLQARIRDLEARQ